MGPSCAEQVGAFVRDIRNYGRSRNLEKIAQIVDRCFDSKDYAEGRCAFMEKREPIFTGK